MPLYEYRCSACGERREVLARSSEAAQPPGCPVCGASMEKLFATVAARTKSGAAGCGAPRGAFS
ncbi:MAG: zinc ribbon domain-containing protein [Thermodesulfobacteriota bacterium]